MKRSRLTRFLVVFLLFALLLSAILVGMNTNGRSVLLNVPAQLVDIRTDGDALKTTQHAISWFFSIYREPNFQAERIANFDPQTVTVLYESPKGWALIHTYHGNYWTYLPTNRRFLDRPVGLFASRGDTAPIDHIPPQVVTILRQEEDWLQISTWQGSMWIDLSAPIFFREPLPEHIIEFIAGVSFKDYTPFPHSFLTYLTITHVGFDGEDRIGHMIVAAEIGDEVLDIFREIYESGFPIYSMRLIDYFDADDTLSMAANNSSAFNFRHIAGTNVISRHGFGMAIDINPIQNPYARGSKVLPAAGREYLDRSNVRPGMIVRGDAVHRAFTSRGWIWGGNWNTLQDFHHFERRG